MEKITITLPLWFNYKSIKEDLEHFREIYKSRPIKNNSGGMLSTHMFYVWFTAKKINPKLIIDSGTYKGQSAWLLKQACPNAEILSFDIFPDSRQHTTKGVEYLPYDFSQHDWRNHSKNSLILFDDHQNAYTRLQQCLWFNIPNIIFEDNYPASQGDCYSLKKIFASSGFRSEYFKKGQKINKYKKLFSKFFNKLTGLPNQMDQFASLAIDKNDIDKYFVGKNLNEYLEYPPLYKTEYTRWKDKWDEDKYPTAEPILGFLTEDDFKNSLDFYKYECKSYTWICYAKLKDC